jgi:UDP-N-acetyl-D-mannosaminuronic acid dehydrogenase
MIPDSFGDRNICIVGLGYVGLTLAVAMAEAGFNVIGIEIVPDIVASVAAGRAHFAEYGLDVRLGAQVARGRIRVATDISEAAGSRVYIVTVGTPIGDDKRTKSAALVAVSTSIGATMAADSLVILRSTVRVGVTREQVKPILDASGKNYDLAFCPERTLEGRALAELVSLPQIVGGIDTLSTFRASQLFSMLTPTIIRVRSPETAELVKLINNTQRDLMFAFANEVAAICDVTGVSAHEVITSGNIGYPRANLPLPGPVGGPCLEKDPYILAEGLERYDFVPTLALTARRWNQDLPERIVAKIATVLAASGAPAPVRIAILGLAFKGRPETDDLRGTMAIPLIEALKRQFPSAQVTGWDAEVTGARIAELRGELGPELGVTPAASAQEAAKGAALVIMQNNHPALEKLDLIAMANDMVNPGLIYDCWNQHARLEDKQLAPGLLYSALGSMNLDHLESQK